VAEARLYANPPLSLVTAEVRLAHEPRLEEGAELNRFIGLLRHDFPVVSTEQVQLSVRDVSPTGGGVVDRTFDQIRGADIDKTRMVSLQPRFLTFATTGQDYRGFDASMVPFIRASIESLLTVAPYAVLEGIGLRYINEIRMPDEDSGLDEWRLWVREDVLSIAAATSGSCRGFRVMSHSHEQDGPDLFGTTVMCGSHWGVSVIGDTSPLAPTAANPRQAIVIDIDGNWVPAKTQLLKLVDTLPIFDRLHRLADEPFEWFLTDHARAQFGGQPHA